VELGKYDAEFPLFWPYVFIEMKDILRISDFVCVGLFKHYLKNNTVPVWWLPGLWQGWFGCDGEITACVTRLRSVLFVLFNVLCLPSSFQAVK
jgi:hypothetical protein